MKHLFNEAQLQRIYELLTNLNDCNTKMNSNCKVSAIAMYADSRNNFVCTYLMKTYGGGDGVQTDIKYVQIDPKGNKHNMLDIYRSEEEVARSIQKMKEITL